MNLKPRHRLLLIMVTATTVAAVWALKRSTLKPPFVDESSKVATVATQHASDPELWALSLERVKENRGDTGNVAIEIPQELRHYDDRRWFLAAQVAEVKKFNLQPVQDFVDLAAMIKRGELVPLPAVTDTFILFGVGARVDDEAFTRYVANQNIELNDEAGLREAYTQLESMHAQLQREISSLQDQLASLKREAVAKQDELQIELAMRQQELRSN